MSSIINVDSVFNELESAYFGIPFGNSDFQDRMTLIARELTPGRAYRHIGLRMFRRIRDIKNLKFQRELQDIDIEEKRSIINSPDVSSFDKRRREIEIAAILDGRSWEDKLLNDAIIELNFLYSEFKKFPRYTKEMFEAEEKDHFSIKHGVNPTDMQILDSMDEFDRLITQMNIPNLEDKQG